MQCVHTIAPRPSLYTVNQSVNKNTIRKETGTNTPSGCADLSLDPRSKLDPPRLNPPSIFLKVHLNDLSRKHKNSVDLKKAVSQFVIQ